MMLSWFMRCRSSMPTVSTMNVEQKLRQKTRLGSSCIHSTALLNHR
jgi:hypothetical protein